MYERSKKIFQYVLQENSPVEIQKLADYFKITTRTVYNDILKLDDFLAKNRFPLLHKMKGAVAYDVNKEMGNQILQCLMVMDENETAYDPVIRRQSIIKYLMDQNNYSTIDEIADHFQVSRNTVINDLKEVKIWFLKFHLILRTITYKGIRVEGTEINIRNTYIDLLKNDYSIVKQTSSDQKKIQSVINMIENRMKTSFTDYFHYQLNLYLFITIMRIRNNRIIEAAGQEEMKYLIRTKELQVIQALIPDFESILGIIFPESEVFYFTKKIVESSLLEDTREGIYEKWLPIHLLTNTLIKEVEKTLKQDFSKDKQLFNGLIHHLRPAYYRMINQERIENPLKDEIISKYSKIHAAVKLSIVHLEAKLGVKFDEEESSFITMFFAAAFERMTKRINRIPTAILVCPSGISTSQMLLSQIKGLFKVNIIGIYSVRKLEKELQRITADFIISTVNLNIDFNKILIVNPVLNDQDKLKLKTFFDELDAWADTQDVIDIFKKYGNIKDELNLKVALNQYFHGIEIQKARNKRREPMLIEVLNENMIAVRQEAKSKEEAVKKSGEILFENNLVEERYIKGMLDNLKENGSYFVIAPGIAMPHARPECGAKEIGFSLITLKEPVVFGHVDNDPVEIVLGLCAIDHQTHLMALAELIDILSIKENIEQIKKADSTAQIMKIIKGVK